MDAEALLVEMRKETDPEARSDLIKQFALTERPTGGQSGMRLLVEALGDGDPVVQEWASVALRRFSRNPEAIRALWEQYAGEQRESVRCYILVALGKLGEHMSAGALRGLYRELRSHEDHLRLSMAIQWAGHTAHDPDVLATICDILTEERRRRPADHEFLVTIRAAALRCAVRCLSAGAITKAWLKEREQNELLDRLGETRIQNRIEEERARRAQGALLPELADGGPDSPLVPGRTLGDDQAEQYVQDLAVCANVRLVEKLSYVRDQFLAREAKKRVGYCCQRCGDHLDNPAMSRRYVHAHHVQPLGKGGPDELRNLAVLCPGCHGRVHAGELIIEPRGEGLVVKDLTGQVRSLEIPKDAASAKLLQAEAAYRRIVELIDRLDNEQRRALHELLQAQLG